MELTDEHYALMKSLRGGADIMGRREAQLCRTLERRGLIRIGKRQGTYKVTGHLPYFGAILTAKGKIALKEA